MEPLWIAISGLAITGLGFFAAAIGLLIRVVRIMTKHEDKIEEVANDLKEIVESKKQDHAAMIRQMTEDRNATNKRLRYLEEKVWKKG
jgi:Na+-transporting methylmalonyl-CoA/oxaloacetate decarboxylase gamma subunit